MNELKPYSGIPAGILDEDLEAYMSKPKRPFDAAKITPLFGMDWVLSLLRACREINKDKPEHQRWIDEAYRVLEAAGKVDKEAAMTWLAWLPDNLRGYGDAGIRALLETLPERGKEVEEEPKRYRCESCGKDFDKKLFSHSRTEENQVGEPVEVECGPISEVK